jgi:hypothetical protein
MVRINGFVAGQTREAKAKAFLFGTIERSRTN